MEEEKNIIDATEYILLALNSITNYDEFIEYKSEISKAVYDIRKSLFTINSIFNIESQTSEEKKEENIIYSKSIRNKFKINNNKNNSINSINNKKNKYNQISDIIMKLNSEDYYYIILTKLFGNDLKEKLISNEVSDELLTAVTNSIQEIESLKKKDELSKLSKLKNSDKNFEETEEEPRQFPINEILGPNYKNYKLNKKEGKDNNINNINDIYQEFDFIKNLRHIKNMNAKPKKHFINATSIYGNYFDPPLQRGGISKLDDYKK